MSAVAAPIPLRSDTATLPTDEMRAAMATAEVGDDANRRDPTVRALEELAADMLGTEAALFLPTGTMGNLVAFLALVERGDDVFALADSHVLGHEAEMTTGLVGLVARPVDGDGILEPAALRGAIATHGGRGVVVVENTHNRSGGRVTPPDVHDAAVAMAREHGLAVHVDGARIFNAAVALGVPVERLARGADTVTFCLSKGLSAPAGSLLCGDAGVIDRARRARKVAGGAMRQSGILAAAGIVAVTTMVERLADDHRRARRLAELLARIPSLRVDPERVETNMVIARAGDGADGFAKRLLDAGVESYALPPDRVRFVTSRMVDDDDIERAAGIVTAVAERASWQARLRDDSKVT
jgi:threonine aldolase